MRGAAAPRRLPVRRPGAGPHRDRAPRAARHGAARRGHQGADAGVAADDGGGAAGDARARRVHAAPDLRRAPPRSSDDLRRAPLISPGAAGAYTWSLMYGQQDANASPRQLRRATCAACPDLVPEGRATRAGSRLRGSSLTSRLFTLGRCAAQLRAAWRIRWKRPSTVSEDSAPSASLDPRKARAAAPHPGAPLSSVKARRGPSGPPPAAPKSRMIYSSTCNQQVPPLLRLAAARDPLRSHGRERHAAPAAPAGEIRSPPHLAALSVRLLVPRGPPCDCPPHHRLHPRHPRHRRHPSTRAGAALPRRTSPSSSSRAAPTRGSAGARGG